MSGKHKDNGKTSDLAEFGCFDADDLYEKFKAECMRVYSDGAAWHRQPGDLASVNLPLGVLPDITQLINPLTKKTVPVVRAAMFTPSDPPPINPSGDIRAALVEAGWTPPGDGS